MVRHYSFDLPNVKKIGRLLGALPAYAGVYLYADNKGQVIYVGKAKNLKNRVSSYFYRSDALGYKTQFLVKQIRQVTVIPTVSEFDAILLEAKLIFAYCPKYNSISKDDKSRLYIKLDLKEKFPTVTFIRKKAFDKTSVIFGPFPSTRDARLIMRSIRRIIPYCTQRIKTGKPCFYSHLGLCNPCPSQIVGLTDKDEMKNQTRLYRQHINKIKNILSGQSEKVRLYLEKEMVKSANNRQFEQAKIIRDQLMFLNQLHQRQYDPLNYLKNDSEISYLSEDALSKLHKILSPYCPGLAKLKRVECVDISNTAGTLSTGSVVVFIDGLADTSKYRRFKIRHQSGPDDFMMIREVVSRRLAHPEWDMPDLLVIDGGKGQLSVARQSLAGLPEKICLVALAKRREEIIVFHKSGFQTLKLELNNPALQFLMRLRDEAHRFALAYHRKMRAISFIRMEDLILNKKTGKI
jgi:excinuclease ABC subunit C